MSDYLYMPTATMPRQLIEFAVMCAGCGAFIPLVRFVADGRPHAQSRCPGCGQTSFLNRSF